MLQHTKRTNRDCSKYKLNSSVDSNLSFDSYFEPSRGFRFAHSAHDFKLSLFEKKNHPLELGGSEFFEKRPHKKPSIELSTVFSFSPAFHNFGLFFFGYIFSVLRQLARKDNSQHKTTRKILGKQQIASFLGFRVNWKFYILSLRSPVGDNRL